VTAKPRVLVTEPIADSGIATLEDGGIEADVRTDLEHDGLVKIVGEYDGLIVRSATNVDHEVVDAAHRMRVIGRAGIGLDNVDVDAATRKGILVVNAPQSNSISAAEHTVALMLALARRIPQAHRSLTEGRWDRDRFMGAELNDKVLGVIGLGNIGTLVAQRCHAFGMRIIATDPFVSPQRAARLGIDLVSVDELLARADFITLHIKLTPETRGMLGATELSKCKAGVRIVNTSRGGVVDETALAEAVRSGHVAGAALDVFETEPTTSSPLFGLDNVVVTPHLGASTIEAQDKAGTSIADQVLLALHGEFVPNAVNLDAGRELPELVRPFLPLAHKLGRLACALASGAVGQIEVEYHGQIAEQDTRVVTLNALRGFLQPAVHEPVTFVNAPLLARDRSLDYGERKSAAATDYLNLVRVVARRNGSSVTVAGTLIGRKNEERLVEIDGVTIEITLSPYMAFFRYDDRPGVVRTLLGPLADANINIATMQVGRDEKGGEAILGLAVDSPVPPEVFQEAMRAAGIAHGRFVVLEGD
jgi:D-3-phosphoglycerate dehydrogenase